MSGPRGVFTGSRGKAIVLTTTPTASPCWRALGESKCHSLPCRKEWRRKDTKGFNTLWEPAKFVCWAVFWWLPKGVVASAIFAQQNPKILLLLQANRFCIESIQTKVRRRRQERLLLRFACYFRVGVFLENANASAETAYFCVVLRGATAQRLLRRTAGFQGVLDPLAPFFRHFLGRAKKWHNRTARRVVARPSRLHKL